MTDKDLVKQIVKFRLGVLHKCSQITDILQDENLDFPVEDQSPFDKGYEKALNDVRREIQKLHNQ